MTYKFCLKKGTYLIVLLNCLVISCNYNTEEILDKTSKILPNGKHIVVEKSTKETTSRGVFTNHNYGTSHRYSYTFLMPKEDINWNGGSGEPKNILFCKDTIYVRYLKEKSIRTKYIDSTDNTTKYNYHSEIHEAFQKHIDERYFFKLFGDDFWVDITSENYSSVKKSCDDYHIPNDNELALKSDDIANNLVREKRETTQINVNNIIVNEAKKAAIDFTEKLKNGKKLAPLFSAMWTLTYHEENRCTGSTNGKETYNQSKIDSEINIEVKNNSEHAWACEKKEEYYYEMVFDLKEKVKDWDRFELQDDSYSDTSDIENNAFYIVGAGESDYIKIYIDENNLIATLKYSSEDPG